ncbi:MAG: cytochrome P450, partial [Acidimicrobiia bacterium]|nr:cytochrome P450 [Acidimicrobiia bacterium]
MSDAPVVPIDVASFWDDPYPVLARMRSETPICFVPELGATLLTRRDDIHACEKNVAVFSSDQPGGLMNVLMGRNMMRKDGDEHRRERFVYYPAISPTTVKSHWYRHFADITDRVLDSLLHSALAAGDQPGAADLVPTYATAVSGEALRIMTGLTDISFAEMDAWSQAMIDGIANYTGDPDVEARCHQATSAIDEAIDRALDRRADEAEIAGASGSDRHQQTGADLLSVMIGAGMPLDQVRANIKLTISGGQNEPRDAIAGAVWAL